LIGYLLRRALLALPLALGAATVVFLFLHLVPGDPVQAMLGPAARDSDLAALRTRLGLDRPLGLQYVDYLRAIAHGDLGTSLHYGDPVGGLLAERLPLTAALAGVTVLFALLLSLPAGIAAGLRPGSGLDRLLGAASSTAMALPSFWLGPTLLLVFAVNLRWLPVSGADVPESVLLPAVTLALPMAALLSRLLAVALRQEIGRPYVSSARARGRGRDAAAIVHALRNASGPMLTALGLQLGSLLTGAVITETIFAWPGIGRLLVRGISSRDYPLVQGCILLFAALYLLANLACDLGRAALDPRVAA
jgi:peptide/nickel transport system permease protein